MNILVLLIPIALFLGALGLVAFLWSLKSGQYSDLEGDAWRAIMDDADEEPKGEGGAEADTQDTARNRDGGQSRPGSG